MSIKEEAKKEHEKLRNMSWKDRVWYIWEYYKFHILGTALAVGLIATIGITIYGNRFDTALYCMVLNDRNPAGNGVSEFEKDLAQFLSLNKGQRVIVDDSLAISFGESTSEMGYAGLAKITALITTKDLDVMIADPPAIQHFSEMDGFMNLNDLPQDIYTLVRDQLYYAKDSDGKDYPCAVILDRDSFKSRTGISLDPPLFAILTSAQHKENSYQMIRYLLE